MAGSPAFELARRGSDHVAMARRADRPPARRPGPAGGLLRPSRVPVPGAAAAPGPGAARAVHDVLAGPGQPLAAPVKEEMQARLGADFSDVRVHAGAAARASAARIGARAYTSGSHVVIGEGGADKHTLAHELTHVIQQRIGPVAGTGHGDGVRLSDPSDPFERAAESTAARVMSRSAPRPRTVSPDPLTPQGTLGGQAVAHPPGRVAPAAASRERALQRTVLLSQQDGSLSSPTITQVEAWL